MTDFRMVNSMRFMFCCGLHATNRNCCCCCSLRVGAQIISVVMLLYGFSSIIILGAYLDQIPFAVDIVGFVSAALFWIIGPLLVLVATCNNNFKTAYLGRLIIEFYTWLILILGFALGIIFAVYWDDWYYYYDGEWRYYNIPIPFFVFYYIVWGFFLAIYLYFAKIIFSFTKELGLRNIRLVNGNYEPLVQPNVTYHPPRQVHQTPIVVGIQPVYLHSPVPQPIVPTNFQTSHPSQVNYNSNAFPVQSRPNVNTTQYNSQPYYIGGYTTNQNHLDINRPQPHYNPSA